jgi:hypothetical protein
MPRQGLSLPAPEPMKPPGHTESIYTIKFLKIYHPIEIEYEQENVVRKYVDCHMVHPPYLHSQQSVQARPRLLRRTFVTGADTMYI